MSRITLALSLVMQLLPYAVRILEIIDRISTDPAVKSRLKIRAKELAIESAELLITKLEVELRNSV
jgi:hypothetical protein